MKVTKNQMAALEAAFNSDAVRAMSDGEFQAYIQRVFTISMGTMRKDCGDQFIIDYTNQVLSSPVEFYAKRVTIN